AAAPPRRRLFFALWPGEREREELARWQEAAGRLLGRSGARPVPVANLHLTLLFAGAVDGPTRDCLELAAEGLRPPGPFGLVLDRLGHFARPQVLWLGGEGPAPLLELVAGLREAAAGCGLEPEARPFAVHLTLFRKVRRLPPALGRPLPGLAPVRWPVRDFVLVASRTLPEGARYEVLRRWPLGRGDPPERADKAGAL
ncbi:MAG: RNA 2',3'-cyclic phosphodiesterase, partial [Gammaproteobacteria bacterium]